MRKCLDLLSNSLNTFFMEMYRDQSGEFVCGYWDLKGYQVQLYHKLPSQSYHQNSLVMNRALKTGTNLCDDKKYMYMCTMKNIPQISKDTAMNSFCLQLKEQRVFSFEQGSKDTIHRGRLPQPTPLGHHVPLTAFTIR